MQKKNWCLYIYIYLFSAWVCKKKKKFCSVIQRDEPNGDIFFLFFLKRSVALLFSVSFAILKGILIEFVPIINRRRVLIGIAWKFSSKNLVNWFSINFLIEEIFVVNSRRIFFLLVNSRKFEQFFPGLALVAKLFRETLSTSHRSQSQLRS